jgi:tetratricopeptide (TPR) repeat protein
MPLPSRNNIVRAVIDIDDTALISEISQIHEQNIYNMYIDKGDVLAKPIEIHIEALMSYVDKLDRDYNNLGYVLTYNKRFKEAIPVLLSTLESVNESDYFRRAMVHYNLAIAQYASGNMEESLKNSEDALRYSEHLAKVRRECGCLLFINDAGKIEESRLSPDLYEFSRNLINLVNTSRELEQDTQPAAEKPTN